nr:hypothetical protein [Hydrogenophaga sp.]
MSVSELTMFAMQAQEETSRGDEVCVALTGLYIVATIYVNGMRSIALVMVILWFFLLVPLLIGKPIGAEMSAVITFIAFEAAYFGRPIEACLAAAVVDFVMCCALSWSVKQLHKKIAIIR